MPGLPVTDIDLHEILQTWELGYSAEKRAAVQFRGILHLTKSGHLLLSVPAALVRGLYDSLADPGLSLPKVDDGNGVRSGIVVMSPEEVEEIGGGGVITERGKTFRFGFGDFFITPAKNWPGVSSCYHWHVRSPELAELRRSYGLPSKIKDMYDFSLIVACKKTGVLSAAPVSKVEKTSEEHFPVYEQPLFLGESASFMSRYFRKLSSAAIKLAGEDLWYIGESDIEGSGVFAGDDLPKDTVIGLAIYGQGADDRDGSKFRNLTALARYCNHLPSHKANTVLQETEDGVFNLVAKRDISADEELTADYADVTRKLGMGVGMRYGSEVMPTVDLSKFKQGPDNEGSGDRTRDT